LVAVLNREEALSRQLLDELPFARRYQTALTLAVGASITSLVAAAVSLALSLR
jgi:hypothetical protein